MVYTYICIFYPFISSQVPWLIPNLSYSQDILIGAVREQKSDSIREKEAGNGGEKN